MSKVFNSVIKESVSFSESFNKLLNDILEDCELIEQYLGGDRLIENKILFIEAQKSLIPLLKKKIEDIKFDIELVQSKTDKKIEMSDISEQNIKIVDLTYNILTINSKFFRDDKESDKEAFALQKEMMKGFITLKQAIIDYNNNHTIKLTTIDEAKEKAHQLFLTGLNRTETN